MINDSHFVLETEEIAVIVAPDEGGRLTSLRSKVSGLEFLTQSSKSTPPADPGMESLFHEGPCAGVEECLPSVAPCGPATEGGGVPDHGDFWQMAWHVTEHPTSTRLCIEATGFSRPLRFRKELHVHGSSLRMSYLVENVGRQQISFLYAHHPLFAVASSDRVIMPPHTQQLALYYSRNGRLGQPGSRMDWPRHSDLDLSVVLDKTACTAEMLYTQRLEDGSCGLWRASQRQGLRLCWDAKALPFLGVWLCYGGWPNIEGFERQYAVALEPTLAPCGSLAEAQQAGMACAIEPSECIRWDIQYEVSRPDTSFEKYTAAWK